MKKTSMQQLKKFLSQKGVFYGVLPSVSACIKNLEQAKTEQRIIKLMYGETYDAFGTTVDSLKYYFLLSLLNQFLEKEGFLVESTIVIADSASVLNPSVIEKERMLQEGKVRVTQVEKIIATYHLSSKVLLMSELFQQKKVQETIGEVTQFLSQSTAMKAYLEKTVLQNRLKQEYSSNFRYAVEAVATALQFDIKLGPPREQYYDKAAGIFTTFTKRNPLYGLYLRPTYPLGKDFTFFISNPEIEEFGITPYKAGSNKLQDFRIILGNTSLEKIRELVNASFFSSDISLANPVIDLYIIADLAKRALAGEKELPIYTDAVFSNEKEIKEKTISFIEQYILKGGAYEAVSD